MGDRRATFIIFLVLISVLASLPNIKAVWAAEDSWTTMSPMPTERFSFGIAVVNDKIFAIGGALATESGELTAANEAYDPATNTWTKRAPMPTPRYGCAATSYRNMIYVFGGGTNESYTNKTEVYDPATNTWETKASMQTARINLQANVVGDKIYLIGGYDNMTLNEVYDPITDTWTNKTPIPTGVSAYASAVFDNKIYVIGGTSTNITQIYDPKTDVWSTGASIPVGIWAVGACSIAGSESPKAIYVLGGETDVFSPQNFTQIYFSENNTWSFGASLPFPRSRLCTAVVDNMIYAIGGTRAIIHQGLTDNEQYTPFGYETIPEFPSWADVLTFNEAIDAISLGKTNTQSFSYSKTGDFEQPKFVSEGGITGSLVWLSTNGTYYEVEYASEKVLGKIGESYSSDWNPPNGYTFWWLSVGGGEAYWIDAFDGSIIFHLPWRGDGPSEPDPFSNLPSAIIGFITSRVGLLLLVITIAIVGAIVILVLVLNRKRKSLEVVK